MEHIASDDVWVIPQYVPSRRGRDFIGYLVRDRRGNSRQVPTVLDARELAECWEAEIQAGVGVHGDAAR